MASVEIKQTPRTVKTIVYDDTVNLSMSREEAEALMWVLEKVGGDPVQTPRGKIEELYIALGKANIKTLQWPAEGPYGSLYFARK